MVHLGVALLGALLLWSPRASGDDLPTRPIPADAAEEERFARELERAPPPPSQIVYFQYGVALTANQILSAGAICDDLSKPCILGAGGGIIVRGGWRSSGPLYIGGAYELTKQDPNKLYRIALLQQARAEVRYYAPTHRIVEPYASGSLGFVGYGNEWAVDTYGGTASVGGGLEYQVTQYTVVGLSLDYRLAYMRDFVDTAGTSRDAGLAQMIGLNIVLEQRAALLTNSDANRRP